jgi:hypothetical protein
MQLAQIEALLNTINGATFAGLDTLTEVKLKGGRANPMLGRVTKRTMGNHVMLFTNKNTNGYDAMVKRRLAAEGKNPDSFKLGALPWGTRLPNSPVIENKGKYYIQTVFLKGGKSEYLLDGQPIEKSAIVGLDDKPIESGKQGLADDNAVVVRTFALDSILEARLMGEAVAAAA